MIRAGHIFFPLLLACTSLAPLFLHADEASERQQGDDAFALEDYARAAEFYQSAMKLAESEKLPDQWAEDALRLARARLWDGNLPEARAILAEFRKRSPLRSAGTLPAELLIAEGKYDEAKQSLEMLRRIAADPRLEQDIRYSGASLLLASGDLPGALREFDALRKSAPAAPGAGEYIYTLIRMGRSDEALAEMAKIPDASRQRRFQLLHYLALAKKGNLTEIRSTLKAWLEKEPVRPQPRILEMLLTAAAQAEKIKDFPLAFFCLKEAEKFTAIEEDQRDIIRRCINIGAEYSPETVVEAARRYAARFPHAADRASLQINVANLLSEKGKNAEAEKLFLSVIEDDSLPLPERMAASADARSVTEKNRNIPLTAKLYEFLAAHAATPAEKLLFYREYADFLRRWDDDAGAAEQLKKALPFAEGTSQKNQLLLSLLEISAALKKQTDTRTIAAQLLASGDDECCAVADFELGKLAEKAGKWDEAAEYYRKSAAFPAVNRTCMPARFAAAMMIRAQGKHSEAGKAFLAFSADFPQTAEASQALYLAAQEFHKAGDKSAEKESIALLSKQYPDSEARAAAVLRTARSRAAEDLPGTIAELESMENEFTRQPPIRQEIMLERARLLIQKGENQSALEVLELLLADPNARCFAESALLKGNILFQKGETAGAMAVYRQAAESQGKGLFQDIAKGRIIDCEIMLSQSGDKTFLKSAAAHCDELIAASRFPAIRLQTRCKMSTVLELSGDTPGAVRACEAAIYEARSMSAKGIFPDPYWSLKALENGLRLLEKFPATEALQRGTRLLDNAASLPLEGSGLNIPELKQNFCQKIKSR